MTGYDSIYSATGIEAAEDKELAGTDPRLAVHNLIGLLTGKPKLGATVYLTISPKAQQAAYQALKAARPRQRRRWPSTRAPARSWPWPPTRRSTRTPTPPSTGTGSGGSITRYLRDPAQPLLNRATMATFPPGSSFKIVTSSTAFSTGKVANPQTTVPAPTSLPLPGSTVSLINDSHEACGDGHPPLIVAFTLSCNTAFGALGIKVGNPALQKYATAFGMNNPNLTIPLPVAQSNYPVLTDKAQTALSAIGQFDDTVTPLQEAMFAAAIANNGTLMKPYLVQQVQAPDLNTIQNASPSVLSQPVSSQVASDVRQMMVQVTSNPAGTAYGTANPNIAGVLIAGKTGTAQNGINNTNLNDAVFTCFAPAYSPRIAVGVIVKGGGFGADAAAPIAVQDHQGLPGAEMTAGQPDARLRRAGPRNRTGRILTGHRRRCSPLRLARIINMQGGNLKCEI